MFGLVLIDPSLQLHAKGVSGIDVLDPKSVRKEALAYRLPILGASHPVDQQGMGMNDELGLENIVQGGFHRWSACIVADRFAHEVLDQFLPGMRLGGGLHVVELVDLDPVEGHESLLLETGQSGARRLDPKNLFILEGGIPSPTLYVLGRSEFMGKFYDGF